MAIANWVVGSEYEEAIFLRLGKALKLQGYILTPTSWAVGGSQELSTWSASGKDGVLLIEAETYVGLCVSGPQKIVANLQRAFSAV